MKEKKSSFFDDSDLSYDEVQKEREPTLFRNLKKDQDLIDAERRGISRRSKKGEIYEFKALKLRRKIS